MRINLWKALALSLSTLLVGAGSANADNAAGQGKIFNVSCDGSCDNGCNAGCESGCDTGCNSCCDDFCAACDQCPTSTTMLFTNFESWRGISDGSFQNNNGLRTGFNWGRKLNDCGWGTQFGASYGAYDFDGRSSFPGAAENNKIQQQVFMTGGFFKRATEDSAWSTGLVYDIMINDNWGVFSDEPYLTQFRGQTAYALSACNEIGVWGTLHDRGDSQTGLLGTTSYRGVDQANLFWHHKFEQGTDSYLWMGLLGDDKLGGVGSLGSYTLGGSVVAPLSDRWAISGDLQYMKPSASTGPVAAIEDSFFVSVGFVYYPGCNAFTRTVAGACSAPYMPVANNGNFLVDASRTF